LELGTLLSPDAFSQIDEMFRSWLEGCLCRGIFQTAAIGGPTVEFFRRFVVLSRFLVPFMDALSDSLTATLTELPRTI
jgi:hypothetical protein